MYLNMAAEAQRLIGISLSKIAQARANRGGVSLHKNLLVATVLQKARYVCMEEAYMMYCQTPTPSARVSQTQGADLIGQTAEDDVQEASLPEFLQPCVRCTSEASDKENHPPGQHPGSEVTYLDLDKSSNVLKERSNGTVLKRRRAITEWETEEAVQSILPKRSKADDDDTDDAVFLEDSRILSDTISKEIETEKRAAEPTTPSGSAMEIDRITSLVSIFSFNISESGNKLNRSVSTPDLCSAQAKETDDSLTQRPFLAMTV